MFEFQFGYDIRSIKSFVDNASHDDLRNTAANMAVKLSRYMEKDFFTGTYKYDEAHRTLEHGRALEFFSYVAKVGRTEEVMDDAFRSELALRTSGISIFHSGGDDSEHKKAFRPYREESDRRRNKVHEIRNAPSVMADANMSSKVTVSELIDALSALDGDSQVVITDSETGNYNVGLSRLKVV